MGERTRVRCAICRKKLKSPQKKYCSKKCRLKGGYGGGRKPVLAGATLQKLENALQNGFTIGKACELANIAESTYYDNVTKDKKFSEKMARAREWATERARQVVVEHISSGDKQAAQWWLERKQKQEFSKREEQTGPAGGPVEHNVKTSVIYRPEKLPPDYWKQPAAKPQKPAKKT